MFFEAQFLGDGFVSPDEPDSSWFFYAFSLVQLTFILYVIYNLQG